MVFVRCSRLPCACCTRFINKHCPIQNQMDNGDEAASSSPAPVSSCQIHTVSAAVFPSPALRKLLTFKVYKRRWFVLLLLFLLNCSNATLWLSFAPVADQSAQYLDVSLDKINWLSVIFMVVGIPLCFVSSWMLDTLGLRIVLILCAWLNMAGAVVRVVATVSSIDISVQYIIVMVGQILCAIAQPLAIFAPTKLAAVWFPDHQRATANMIASMSNPLGILLANVISPNLTQTPAQIPVLMLVYTIPACIICLISTVGIRSSTPPTPPSASALTAESEPFFQGIKLLLKNKPYLLLMVCFASNIGVITCWTSVLQQVLCVQGYENEFSGMCCALFVVFGVVGAGGAGIYTDKTKKFIEVLKISLSIATLMSIAISVVTLLPQQHAVVATIFSLFGFFTFSIYPVFLELSVECSYPVGVALATGLIFAVGQILSTLYVMLLQALTKRLTESPLSTCSDITTSWKVPNMVIAGITTVSNCILVLFFHTKYHRLEAEERVIYGVKPENVSGTADR